MPQNAIYFFLCGPHNLYLEMALKIFSLLKYFSTIARVFLWEFFVSFIINVKSALLSPSVKDYRSGPAGKIKLFSKFLSAGSANIDKSL